MKPFMGINSCFTECIYLDLRHMWQRPRSSAATYSKTTVIETPQSARTRRKETYPSPDRKEEKTCPPPDYKAGRDISTRGRTGGYSLTVPRRKGGKRCVRLRTARRETAALHMAQLESRSKGWFDRGRLDPHDDRPKDKPTSGLLRSAKQPSSENL
jgi:hypothetical protein